MNYFHALPEIKDVNTKFKRKTNDIKAKIFFWSSKEIYAWKISLNSLAIHIFPQLLKLNSSSIFLAENQLLVTSIAGATHLWRGESWERSRRVRGVQNPGSCHGPSQFRSSPPEQSLREVIIKCWAQFPRRILSAIPRPASRVHTNDLQSLRTPSQAKQAMPVLVPSSHKGDLLLQIQAPKRPQARYLPRSQKSLPEWPHRCKDLQSIKIYCRTGGRWFPHTLQCWHRLRGHWQVLLRQVLWWTCVQAGPFLSRLSFPTVNNKHCSQRPNLYSFPKQSKHDTPKEHTTQITHT